MKDIEQMIQVNKGQAEFYDAIHKAEAAKGHSGYSENKSANWLTRFWADLRYKQQSAVKAAGIEDKVKEAHKRWSRLKTGGDFLEVGCFSGSRFTFHLAELAGSYLGVELSPQAVEALNKKFMTQGLAHKAKARAIDFLTMDSDKKFDVIYAHGVLHHFENPAPLFEKLAALANPDALLIFCEPSAVNPVYHAFRAIYRPFQSDASWEWPFTDKTIGVLERHFEPMEGFGWGSGSLPLSVLTGTPLIGGLMRSLYLRQVRQEVEKGWHSKVWNNSYVTAVYRLKHIK